MLFRSGSLITYMLLFLSLQIRANGVGAARGVGGLFYPILFASVPVFAGLLGVLASPWLALSGPESAGLSVLLALTGAAAAGIWMAWRLQLLPGRSGGVGS